MLSLIFSVLKPIAYISLPVIIINSVASSSPKSHYTYYVRSVTYAGTMAMVGACSVVIAAGMAVVGEKYNVNYVVARTFYWTASKIMNIEVEVEGEEHLLTQPAMLVSNHQSMLDVLVLARVLPKRSSMTAKRSIQFTPLGPFMTLSGAIFVDRGSNTKAVKSLQTAGETIKREHISIFMYPEGTRHSHAEPVLLPFKKGPFHLSVQANIPIVPIVTENYWHIYRVGFFGKGIIKVKVLPPISTAGLTTEDVNGLSIRVRDQMLETLCEISTSISPAGADGQSPARQLAPGIITDLPESKRRDEHVSEALSEDKEGLERLKLGSVESIQSSADSRMETHLEGSENGLETEEDEGMVLVGRPKGN